MEQQQTPSKTYTGKELDTIKTAIEKMSNSNQLKFLQFFVEKNITVNKNKTGIRINLGYLYQNHRLVFDEMMILMSHLEQEESLFQKMEMEKKILVQSLKEE